MQHDRKSFKSCSGIDAAKANLASSVCLYLSRPNFRYVPARGLVEDLAAFHHNRNLFFSTQNWFRALFDLRIFDIARAGAVVLTSVFTLRCNDVRFPVNAA